MISTTLVCRRFSPINKVVHSAVRGAVSPAVQEGNEDWYPPSEMPPPPAGDILFNGLPILFNGLPLLFSSAA